MALRAPSLFLYNLSITTYNQYLSFNCTAGSKTAVIQLGDYSLNGLGTAIVAALQAQDVTTTYSFSVDRTIMAGTQNRLTITSSDVLFELLFSSGNPSNPASLIGFNAADYTGAVTYTGSSTCGTALVPNQLAYTFLPPTAIRKNFGAVNISASGLKETITFSLQKFWQAKFRYIPDAIAVSEWTPLIDWMISQKEFEFTPEISNPTVFYVTTLEGLELSLTEQLPDFPFNFETPLMKFRISPNT